MNRGLLLWLLVGALLIAGVGAGVLAMSRGIRNNNPGNIRHGSSKWQGMSAEQTDREFVQFDDPVYGIRALARLLKNYQSRHGLRTIRAMISRWAPPSENDTEAYIAHVSNVAGVHPSKMIDVNEHMVPIVKAIVRHENGQQPYSNEQIARGISLA